MSNIFYLPRAQSLPGAKLTFSISGTSTPQNTYQDAALTTPHANPVVADADGYFAVIYLDPSLPNYRMTHTDSLDALIEPALDGIPASQIEARFFRLKHTAPELLLEETDATSNNAMWRIKASGEQLVLSVGNDAESSWTDFITVNRTGTTVDSVAIAGTTVTINGAATQESGSFTGTLTGYASGPTPTIQWRRSGTIVTLSCNAGSSGTSNADGLTMTGVPAGIRPLQTMTVLTRLTDNGTVGHGVAIVSTGGTITFGNGITGAVFTTSGTKGLPGGWSLIYEMG